MSGALAPERQPPQVMPGLTLLFARPVPGGPGAAFITALETRLGRRDEVGVFDLDTLERQGLARKGPLARAAFQEWLTEQAARALHEAASEPTGRARLPIFTIAPATEARARHTVYTLPAMLHAAGRRLTLPRGVEPFPVSIWMLPERWSALKGAELFAWLKQFARAIGPGEQGRGAPHKLNVVLGRSRVQPPDAGDALSCDDDELAARAAEFVAAAHTSSTLDWMLAAGRGIHGPGRFHAIGIAPLQRSAADEDAIITARRESRVLWPTGSPTHHEGVREARAVVGCRRNDMPPPGCEKWDRVAALGSPAVSPGWLCRVAIGLRPEDVFGAEDWRAHYMRLSPKRRRRLHGHPDAVDWPDPLERSDPAARDPELTAPILPVLDADPDTHPERASG